MYSPIAILAMTGVRSFMLIGDSRNGSQGSGNYDNAVDMSGYNGELPRVIGRRGGFINCGVSSTSLAQLINNPANYTNRVSLIKYTTAVVLGLGINDLNSFGRTAAQLVADIATFAALFPNPLYCTTLPPVSTSVDSWATVVNQTTAASNANRVTYNNLLRTGNVAGVHGYIEIADAVESSRDSGKWNAVTGGTAPSAYTADGLHELTAAGVAIQNSKQTFWPT